MKLIKTKLSIPSMKPDPPKQRNWLKISLVINIVVIVLIAVGIGGYEVVHLSDTNPQFCATCHLMSPQVNSYLHGTTMDSVHAKAGVQCKDCHDYPLSAEITSGINYLIGNYDAEYTADGNTVLAQRKFSDAMCLKCHISYDYLANQTDFLTYNPHKSHWSNPNCSSCHISHSEQIDYCADCHENGNQRMTGGPIIPRAENPWATGKNQPANVPTTQATPTPAP